MTKIGIIGSGIKGSALAALLARAEGTVVVVFEASGSVSGATSTNHGRLHAGTASWRTDSTELMAHRQVGSQLWRILGVAEDQPPAYYLFDDYRTGEDFAARCDEAGIPFRQADRVDTPWAAEAGTIYEIPEYSFAPAPLAGSLMHFAVSHGVQWCARSSVTSVSATQAGLRAFSRESFEDFDVLVNCTGRWSDAMRVDWRSEALFELEWFEWPILFVPMLPDLPPLGRVIVRASPDGGDSSVIPHGEFVTVDVKVGPTSHPRDLAPSETAAPSLVDPSDPYRIECERAFPVLRRATAIYSFTGIQGRIRNAPAGSIGTVVADPVVPGYIATYGGQASTAVLDAINIASHLWKGHYVNSDPYELFYRLCDGKVSEGARVSRYKMAWEDGPQP